MPRTLSVQAEAARIRRDVDVVPLLELALYRDRFAASVSEPTLVRLSDAHRTELGVEWLGLVKHWGPMRLVARGDEAVSEVDPIDVWLDNTVRVGGRARLSDLFRVWQDDASGAAFDMAGSEATVAVILKGTATAPIAGDEVVLSRYAITAVELVEPESVRLRLIGIPRFLELLDSAVYTTLGNFPKVKTSKLDLPIPYLLNGTRIRGVPVRYGAQTTSRQAISATVPGVGDTLEHDTETPLDFDRFPPSGSFWIPTSGADDEVISYSSKTTTGFVVSARGACGSTAAAHSAGVRILERVYNMGSCSDQSGTLWVFAENPPGFPARTGVANYTVTTVQNNGVVSAAAGGANLNLDDTSLIAGRSFIANNRPNGLQTANAQDHDYEFSLSGDGTIDDAEGSLTGTPNALLHRPANAIQLILTAAYGQGRRTVGPKQGSAFADVVDVGTIVWINPANAQASDDSRATATLAAGQTTHSLEATGFGFVIPLGARIQGIKVSVELSADTATAVEDNSVQLVRSTGASVFQADAFQTDAFQQTATLPIGSNKARAAGTWWPTTDTVIAYGDLATDLWGTTWTPSQVNQTGFGVRVSARAPITGAQARIDQITISVAYTYLGASFTVAAARQTQLGEKWLFAYRHQSFTEFQRLISRQTRGALYVEGALWEYRLLEPRDEGVRRLDDEEATLQASLAPGFDTTLSISLDHDYLDYSDKFSAHSVFTAPPEAVERFGRRVGRVPQSVAVTNVGAEGTPIVALSPVLVPAVTRREWAFPWYINFVGSNIHALLELWLQEYADVPWLVTADLSWSEINLALLDSVTVDLSSLATSDPDGARTFELRAITYDFERESITLEGAEEMAIQPPVGQCRLVYVSATQLRLDRYQGRYVAVKDAGGWKLRVIPSGGITLSNSGLAASTQYHIYLFDSGGTLTLVAATTAHAVDADTGVEIKSGDATRSLVGRNTTNASSQFTSPGLSWFNNAGPSF